MNQNYIFPAMQFAMEAHKNQVRKYTGEPYFKHLAEVAAITASVADWEYFPEGEMVAIAWLHDCMEDQNVSFMELDDKFSWHIAQGVLKLSDLEVGNRAERKRLSRERLAAAPGYIQTIKCADLISNTSSIVLHDPDFAKVYLREKRELLDVLDKADRRLWNIAKEMAG